jgi:hypothetical protein
MRAGVLEGVPAFIVHSLDSGSLGPGLCQTPARPLDGQRGERAEGLASPTEVVLNM